LQIERFILCEVEGELPVVQERVPTDTLAL
jgi:hypothetical protein